MYCLKKNNFVDKLTMGINCLRLLLYNMGINIIMVCVFKIIMVYCSRLQYTVLYCQQSPACYSVIETDWSELLTLLIQDYRCLSLTTPP